VFYIYRLIYKKSKLQEIYKTETRISKKIHDEVANDIYSVMTLLQADENRNHHLLDDLEAIYTKTRDISRENASIDLNVSNNFAQTLEDLLLIYSNDYCNVITKNSQDINWTLINDDKKRAVFRILQELLTNMKKHSKANLVVLEFLQTGRKITVKYRDNGVGSTLKKKNGLQNVESRISVLNGTIFFDSQPGKGFKVMFTF
jgi:signal transduction histidine kinase